MTSSTPTPPGTPGSSGDRPGPGLRPPDPPGGRRAVLVWSVGVSVYFVAIIFRTSLGVAGLDAADRFEINASALSTFSILQLLVYAGMQIPVGLMVDRVGTKRVLTWGVILFTLGQLGFAFFPHYGMALVSRALLGCGDAMTFISVLRLGSRWFPARRGPLVGQLAGLVGMAGNLVSTLVLARLLHGIGWEAAFGGSALLGVLVLGLMLLFLKDHPEGHAPPPVPKEHRGAAFVRHQIARSWAEPGTRLGLWTHFTTQFPAMVYLLLWGLPYLVEAQGMTRAEAGELLTLVVLANMVIGLVYGQLIARNHRARSVIVLGTVLATGACWAAVLSWPGTAPAWLLLVHAMVLGACGPASMVGFDFARPANPPERQGTASGIVNMGGFTASMTSLLAIGVLLDLTGDNYRVAFSVLLVLQAFGTAQILRLRRAALRRESERLVASRVETVHVPA